MYVCITCSLAWLQKSPGIEEALQSLEVDRSPAIQQLISYFDRVSNDGKKLIRSSIRLCSDVFSCLHLLFPSHIATWQRLSEHCNSRS